MNSIETTMKQRVRKLCDRRVAGDMTEDEFRDTRRQYLLRMVSEVNETKGVHVEWRWALSRPLMLVGLTALAIFSVVFAFSTLPTVDHWFYR